MESWRGSGGCLQSLVSQDCQGRFRRLGGVLFVPAFPTYRLEHELEGPCATAASLQLPNEDAIEHGLFRALWRY
eukprot:1143458-Pelagomonas_calceolata.AAC.1